MASASAYSAVKSALVTQLAARSGLAGVAVSYQAPVDPTDVKSTGSYEAIWCDDAEGDFADVVLCAGDLRFDESYIQTLVVQVMRPTRLGTQRVADERAQELLYEVHAELAAQNDWDLATLGLDDFDYLQVTPATQTWVTGFLPSGAGHAARCELGLLVESRRSFP